MGNHFNWKSAASETGSYCDRPTTPPRVSLLELDHVVTDRAEVSQVIDIPSILVDERIAETQRQILEAAFFWRKLQIEIVLVLPKLPRLIRGRAKHPQRIGAQPFDPGKVITSSDKERTFTGPEEVLHLDTCIAGITAPRVPQGDIPPGISGSRGKQQRLRHRQI